MPKRQEQKHKDGAQKAYFGLYIFSLSTACVYHLDEDGSLIKKPIAAVSESSDRSRTATLKCIDFVIKEVDKQVALMKMDAQLNYDLGSDSSFTLHTVPIYSSTGTTIKPTMTKVQWTVSVVPSKVVISSA